MSLVVSILIKNAAWLLHCGGIPDRLNDELYVKWNLLTITHLARNVGNNCMISAHGLCNYEAGASATAVVKPAGLLH